MFVVTQGFLSALLVVQGYGVSSVPTVLLFPVDPRLGTILSPDSDPAGVNPRMGSITIAIDPRGGTILSPDSDPNSADPRQGSIIN